MDYMNIWIYMDCNSFLVSEIKKIYRNPHHSVFGNLHKECCYIISIKKPTLDKCNPVVIRSKYYHCRY